MSQITLSPAVQGARHEAQVITWANDDGTPLNLTNATLSATKRLANTSTVTAIDGSLAITTAGSGIFTWTYGAGDVGTAGTFLVQFVATFTQFAATFESPWQVFALQSATAVAAEGVVGIPQGDADYLEDLVDGTADATDGQVWTADGAGGAAFEDPAGGAVALDDITDVVITTPADNEVLAFDNTSGDWINQTAAEAGLSATGHTHSYQPADDDLTAIADLSSADGNFIVGSAGGWVAESGATVRTSLGLGTLATQNGTFSGGGTFASGSFTLTVPATGTAALLGAANVFTAVNTFNSSPTSPQGDSSERFGAGASCAGNYQLAVGNGAVVSGGGYSPAVAMGPGSIATGLSDFVCGSAGGTFKINDVFFGRGQTSSQAAAGGGVTFHATGGSGTNIAGGSVAIAAGRGTGNAASGRVVFQTSPAGASGATLQTLKDRWSIPQAGTLDAWQESSTTTRQVLGIVPTLPTATDASRTGRAVFNVYDNAATREVMRLEANGSAAAWSLFGTDAAPQQAHIADSAGDDAATVNAILDVLEAFGLVATS